MKLKRAAAAALVAGLLVGGGVAQAGMASAAEPVHSPAGQQLRVTQETGDAVILAPYVYFNGTEQYLGVDGSQTYLSSLTPVQVQLFSGDQLIGTRDGGVRSNGTLYLDGDFDLGAWNQGNAIPGSSLRLVAVEQLDPTHVLGRINAVLPQPQIAGLTGGTWHGNRYPFRDRAWIGDFHIDNVPVGTPVTITATGPSVPDGRLISYRTVNADWQVSSAGWQLWGYGGDTTVTVTVDGTQSAAAITV